MTIERSDWNDQKINQNHPVIKTYEEALEAIECWNGSRVHQLQAVIELAIELGAKDDMDKSDIIIDVDRALTENTSSSDEFGIDDRALAVDSDGWILLFDVETGTYDTDTIETGDDDQDDDDDADDVEWVFNGSQITATLSDGQEWTFYHVKNGYVFCDFGDESRQFTLGSQICYGGGVMGDTIYESGDQNFTREVKKWMRQHLSPKLEAA